MQYCPNGVFADGLSIKAEQPTGGDNTGANAVCILCKGESKCSKEGSWGTWSEIYKCPEGSYLYGWRQNVESPRGTSVDDTSLDNVEYKCKSVHTGEVTKTMKGNGHEWGDWSRFQGCPPNQFICGIDTRVEDWVGADKDDTALNDIEHQCCEIHHS